MISLNENIVPISTSGRAALIQLDRAKTEYKVLFIVNENSILLGTLTDGDIRRGLIAGKDIDGSVSEFMNKKFRYVDEEKRNQVDYQFYKTNKINLVPVVGIDRRLVEIIDLVTKRAILPVDAVIMAGGRGERLRPLTDSTPKPLLKVGNKPIIEHNIDRLTSYGIINITITVKYLGNQLIEAFGSGEVKGINIKYIQEENALGTLGAVSLIKNFENEHVLIMNSDLLTNINFEDFFQSHLESNADIAIATIPYKVNVPYAVLEVSESKITSFKEKPSYTYYSNAGIYLIKRDLLTLVPKGEFYNATDLMDLLIRQNKNVISYPILGYWLDIGKHEDFAKAQHDIKHINF